MMTKLFAETIGQGLDIVLLHGWGMHGGIWQSVSQQLSLEFRVTLIDLPGFGRSDTIPHYTAENIATYLKDIAPQKAVWIGWSLGALIAIRFALAYPERVSKLVCVASSPRFLKSKNWPGIASSLLEKFSEQLNLAYETTIKRFLLLQFHGMAGNKKLLRWLYTNLFLHGKPNAEALNAGLTILQKEDLRDSLKAISCPILYILGKLDALVPRSLAEALPTLNPAIESVVLSKASHALFLSHEHEFLVEVKRFISS